MILIKTKIFDDSVIFNNVAIKMFSEQIEFIEF